MNTRIHDRASSRSTPRFAAVASLGLLWLTQVAGAVPADAPDDRWQINVPLYLTAGSHYYTSGNTSGAFNFVSAYVEAVVSSHTRPYSAGLFVDYSYSTDSRHDGSVNIGGLVEYDNHRWDANAYLFTSKSPGTPNVWLYASRVRYRVAENHKFGIALVGTLRNLPASNLMVGYYTTISGSLSLNIVAGVTLNSGRDRAARTELVWQIK